MNNTEARTVTITAEQIKEARRLLGWSSVTLARRADRTPLVIAWAERSALPPNHRDETLAAIRHALELGGAEFIPATGGAAGVRLRGRDAADGGQVLQPGPDLSLRP